MTVLAMPTTPTDVTAAWLSAALSETYPGTTVTSVRVANENATAATKLRVVLEYAPGSPAGLPSAVCIKASFDNERVPQLEGGGTPFDDLYVGEGRFYRDLAPRLSEVMNLPRCHYAAVEGARSIMVLEDLVDSGAVFGSYDAPLAADAAAVALSELARLHAWQWEAPELLESTWLRANPVLQILKWFLTEEHWETHVVGRPRYEAIPGRYRDLALIERALKALWAHQDDRPTCLIHGDPHIGNLFTRPGEGPAFLDWQVVCRGRWAFDAVYFLVGAMTIEDRRASDRDLLVHYLDELRAAGANGPSFDDAWLDYRRYPMHGFMNFFTPDGIQTEDYNRTIGERFAVAALDLDSLGALGVSS